MYPRINASSKMPLSALLRLNKRLGDTVYVMGAEKRNEVVVYRLHVVAIDAPPLARRHRLFHAINREFGDFTR